ncbi:MAG TPA: zinc metalloprotease HtpX [archaeon]|nr:zinc metalloprotease HtpX [archaeon]
MSASLVMTMGITLFLLFGFLFAILAVVGYYVGLSGYLIVTIAIALVVLQWFIGPNIIWWTTNMRQVQRKEYPWLFDIIAKICKKTKTPLPERVAIVNDGSPNAFVFGRTPSSATFAVTRGLLNGLTREEVEGVVAHEIGHINHKDMVVMTVAAAIPTIMYFVARFLIYAPSSGSKKSGGGAVLIGIGAFLIYFITNLLVLTLSRLREYYADRFSASQTNPRHLASALAKIAYGLSVSKEHGNDAVRAFFISDPVTARYEMNHFADKYEDFQLTEKELREAMEWEKKNPFARISEIFRTHPLTFKRIKALMEMAKES